MTAPTVFAFLVVLVLVGRALRDLDVVPATAADTLNVVALYVCTPASVLLNAPKLTLERDLVGLVAIPWLLVAATLLIAPALARALGLARDARACLLLEAPLGNTAYLGYALIPALVSPDAMRYAVAYDQLGSFLVLVIYGLLVVAAHGGGARPTPMAIVRRVITFPPFVALVLGLTVMPATPPTQLGRPLELLSGALLPIVALALGMQLRFRLPREHRVVLACAVTGKLVVAPLIALGACAAFGMKGEIRTVAVLQSAMPTMMTAGAMLSMAGLAPELAAAIVGYSTLLSMGTLPLLRSLL